MIKTNKFSLILIAYLCATIAYSVNMWFSVSGVYLLVAAVIILIAALFLKNSEEKFAKGQKELFLSTILIIFLLLNFSLNVVDINGELSIAMLVNRFCLFLSVLISLLYFFNASVSSLGNFLIKNKFLILVFLALVIELTSLRILKKPDIDVYDVLRNGPVRVLKLENPYETLATSQSLSVGDVGYHHYAYGPTTIYFFLPFDIIFKDPRYLLIVASLVTVYFINKIARLSGQSENVSQLLALLFLFSPRLFNFLSYSWTDGLIICLIGLAFLAFVKKRLNLFAVALALALGIKVFYIIPLLMLLKIDKLRSKKVLFFGLMALFLIHLPFIITNFSAMYKSIVKINTDPEIFAPLRRSGLTFATLLDRQFHYYPPEKFFVFSAILVPLISWFAFKRLKKVATVICVVSLVFIISVFFGPIGNASYYFTASSILLYSLAMLREEYIR